ncbi:hypothetical protein Sbal195_4575 (plasmid) [Shewanella baltica OS195]|uniref:Uncharacterized protein n=1 Tax=Shewanella baltica (strain OS195) TaxID=399599 RepID=A9L6E9_SHEB9|nr:hypothetical protein [Shewanella baltica]ABX51731.1 hypothetical protein Sbal195_4575 [Shewanella baltica OS195]
MFLFYIRTILVLCFLGSIAAVIYAIPDVPIWLMLFFAFTIFSLYASLHITSVDSEKSAWQIRKTEVAPDAEMINVEVRAKDGSKKVIWGVRPDTVDFTDSATEPVISFMVVNNLGVNAAYQSDKRD